MTNLPDNLRSRLPMLDGVGIMPQAEPPIADVPLDELPAEFQPRPASADPMEVRRASEEFRLGRQLLLLRVFGLMVGALLLTAAVAFIVGEIADLPDDFRLRQVHLQILFFCELASVIWLARNVARFNTATAGVVLFVYAAFNGVSFSVFAPHLPPHAVAYGFLMTGVTFGVMWLYGYVTGMNLARVRAWAIMLGMGFALVLLGWLVLPIAGGHAGAAFIGIVFFCNLVAYHADDIEDMYLQFDDDANGWKAAFCGALLLYLDFVNLYILILSALARANKSVTSED